MTHIELYKLLIAMQAPCIKRTFTTHPPAVTDVFDSGRNVGALRPGRRGGFR